MKNEKICFNKSVGIIVAVVAILGMLTFGAIKLSQLTTSTSSRAFSCDLGKDIGGGMYQCQANCGASTSGKCYNYVHNSPDKSCTQCNGLPTTTTQVTPPAAQVDTAQDGTVEPTGSSTYIPSSAKDVAISVWKLSTDPKGKLVPQTVQGNTVSLKLATGKEYYKNNYFACLQYKGSAKIDTYVNSLGDVRYYASGVLFFTNEDENSIAFTTHNNIDNLVRDKYFVWPTEDGTSFCKVISIKGLGSRTLTGKYGATIGGANVSFVPEDLIIQVN